MSILDGRQAVQDRLDALDSERDVLRTILDGYDRLAAMTQPEQAGEQPAPVLELGAGASSVAEPPARRHAKESFLCGRCGRSFSRKGWRDRHEQREHEPIPDVSPRGGERIRRAPPPRPGQVFLEETAAPA